MDWRIERVVGPARETGTEYGKRKEDQIETVTCGPRRRLLKSTSPVKGTRIGVGGSALQMVNKLKTE
jgi:hypothetical protein